ncbi:MAG: alpha/beta hydrolase-fold protein, partial [Actinomycetota bacterium]
RGGDHNSFRGDDAMFVALSRLGPRAPIVAFPDGGDHSYWHNRADGDWGDYVVNEVVPQVARSVDANPRRVAIGGISMGGFGAYDLVLKHPGRYCAVGGHSPALWRTGGETGSRRFDDASDFAPTTWSEQRATGTRRSCSCRSGSTPATRTRSSPRTARSSPAFVRPAPG